MAQDRMPQKSTAAVFVQKIPYLPRKIRLSDIKDVAVDPGSSEWRFYWHTKEKREHILAVLKGKEDGWYKKSHRNGAPFHSPDEALQLGEYDIIIHNGTPFALYKGLNSNTHVGAGTYGTVKYLQNIESGKLIAIKIFSARQRGEINQSFRIHSVDILHDNATQEHYFLSKLAKLATPQSYVAARVSPKKGNQYYNLMKLESGIDLHDYFVDYPTGLGNIVQVMKNIAQLLFSLHKKFLHRDLKMENIIINPRSSEVKLVDFGLSCKRSDEPHGTVIEHHADGTPVRVGTTKYMAPETYTGRYSVLSDIYSIGEIYVRLLHFYKPQQTDDRFTQLLPLEQTTHYIEDPDLRKELYRLCTAMKDDDEKERPALTNVLQFLNSLPTNKIPALQIGMIDIQLLTQLPDFVSMERLLSALFYFYNEVHLIDTNSMTPIFDRARFIHQFETAKLIVGGSVYVSKDPAAAKERLAEDLQQKYPGLNCTIKPINRDYLATLLLMKLMLQPTRQAHERKQITLFLKQGAKSTVRDQYGNTPIHLAIKQNDVRTLRRLLRRKADPNARDGDQRTPLYLAVKMNNPAMVKSLLHHGADPTMRKLPLELAEKKGYEECEKHLRRAIKKRKKSTPLRLHGLLKPSSTMDLKPMNLKPPATDDKTAPKP